jgi:uncharacterized protein (TIGR00290 family)
MKPSVLLSWSGGKDSAMALEEMERRGERPLLLTTVTEGVERISMHGVRRQLLKLQAESLGCPLEELFLPLPCSNELYEERMGALLTRLAAEGMSRAVFGDIFLEQVRRYREERLGRAGFELLFPLWGIDTATLARRFIASGYRAVVVCVDARVLDGSFAGRDYDEGFLSDLPAGVDPCGENGEFHTFVTDGPPFRRPVKVLKGETVVKEERFVYCDLTA